MGRVAVAPDDRQLHLGLEADEPRSRRLALRVPGAVDAPFDDPDTFFEPWWAGAAAFVRLEARSVLLQVPHLVDPGPSFPELGGLGDQVAGDQAILEGTLLVLDEGGRPDAALLRERLGARGGHGSGREDLPGGTAAFVASDLLAFEGRDLRHLPFGERRGQLLRVLPDGRHAVASRGVRGEGTMLAEVVAAMGMDALSARRLEAPWRAGPAGPAWLRVPVATTPSPDRRPFLAVLRRLPLGDTSP